MKYMFQYAKNQDAFFHLRHFVGMLRSESLNGAVNSYLRIENAYFSTEIELQGMNLISFLYFVQYEFL